MTIGGQTRERRFPMRRMYPREVSASVESDNDITIFPASLPSAWPAYVPSADWTRKSLSRHYLLSYVCKHPPTPRPGNSRNQNGYDGKELDRGISS